MLELYIENQTAVRVDEEQIGALFGWFLEVLKGRIEELVGGRPGEINLIFVGDEEIHKINRDCRKRDQPTDVISFAYLEAGDFAGIQEEITVGDIFISVDTAERQAISKEHSFQKEVDILFVHGLLHVVGFDHQNDEEEAEMEGWAKKILDF